jgi:hypothetical protein
VAAVLRQRRIGRGRAGEESEDDQEGAAHEHYTVAADA